MRTTATAATAATSATTNKNMALATRPQISRAALFGLAATLLAGCAVVNPFSREANYRCDNGLSFVLRADESVMVQTARGQELLLRDAGGMGAQAVYSNRQMRVQTGEGADGRSASMEGMVPNNRARCSRS